MENFLISKHVLPHNSQFPAFHVYLPHVSSAGCLGSYRFFWWKDFSLRNVWLLSIWVFSLSLHFSRSAQYVVKLLSSSRETLKNILKVKFILFYSFLIRMDQSHWFRLDNTDPLFPAFIFCFELKSFLLLSVTVPACFLTQIKSCLHCKNHSVKPTEVSQQWAEPTPSLE